MKHSLLTTPLLAATLLLGTLGCAKKADPAPAPAIRTGSYRLDGVAKTCSASAYEIDAATGNQPYDQILVILSYQSAASATEFLWLRYHKAPGQPTSAYQLAEVAYDKDINTLPVTPYTPGAATLQEVSSGVYSGTFSATMSGSTPSTISEGVFTSAQH